MNIQWKNKKLKNFDIYMRKRLAESEELTVAGRTLRIKPFRIAVIFVSALLILIIAFALLGLGTPKARETELNLKTGGSYSSIPVKGGIVIYNRQHVAALNRGGKIVWKIDTAMSNPLVEAAGKYVLLADLGGKNYAALYKEGKLVCEFSPENDIISAEVNAKGYTVLATDTVGYKGNVKVFDKKGKEKFSWNSGDGYITDVAINGRGSRIAVSQMLSSKESASSCVQFIDLSSKKVVRTAERENSLISEIRYLGSRLISVSESELCGFSASGRLSYSVSFAGRKVERYDISSNNLLAFTAVDNRGNYVLELYTPGGKLKGVYNAEGSIKNFSVSKDTVVAASHRDILHISPAGKLKKRISGINDIKNIGLYGDGRTVLTIGDTSASIIRLR